MIRLRKSEVLKRIIRQDDATDLAIPTWDLVTQAMKAGQTKEALELMDYLRGVSQRNNDGLASFLEQVLSELATSAGEEPVAKLIHHRYYPIMVEWLASTPGAEESLQRSVESQRGHHANLTIKDEPDRYVVTYDPCGTGNRMRRTRPMGTTKKPYPWSWSKAGVPYYCTHCCIKWEVIPIELRGYPVRINVCPEKPEQPCVHLFYKKPELIPEEYFHKVGKTKTIK